MLRRILIASAAAAMLLVTFTPDDAEARRVAEVALSGRWRLPRRSGRSSRTSRRRRCRSARRRLSGRLRLSGLRCRCGSGRCGRCWRGRSWRWCLPP